MERWEECGCTKVLLPPTPVSESREIPCLNPDRMPSASRFLGTLQVHSARLMAKGSCWKARKYTRLTPRECLQVCVKVESEEQLLEMAAAATARGLVTSVIEDAGRTQVPKTHSSPIVLHLTAFTGMQDIVFSLTDLVWIDSRESSWGTDTEALDFNLLWQVEAGSRTVCGIGPGPAKLIDEVAGMLKLL